MTTTLSSLIDDVQARAPSDEPLDLLATASAGVAELNDVTDALLAHFVDRCRRAGHSWAEIGGSLGVTKQAVQKRFTAARSNPAGWDRWTPRAKRVVAELAPAAAEELGHVDFIGTEHLLVAIIDEGGGVAAVVLRDFDVARDAVVAGVAERVPPGTGRGGYTPRAWSVLTNCIQQALELGHNYVGTEHLLLALLGDTGGVANDVLAGLGVDHAKAKAKVVALLESPKHK